MQFMPGKFNSYLIAATTTTTTTDDYDDDTCFTAVASKEGHFAIILICYGLFPPLPLPSTLPYSVCSLNMGRFSLYFQQFVSSYEENHGCIICPRGVRNYASVGVQFFPLLLALSDLQIR